jgi:hypothetical protein
MGRLGMSNQLEVIVQQSGLEQTKAKYILEKFQDYFKLAHEWEAKAKTIKVTDESQKPEMAMARTGRLFLREKRIAIEKARKELKEQALREGKAIDGIANVLKALIVPIEEYLDKQEHFVENRQAEKEAAEKAEAERKAEEERIENERLDRLERERRETALEYKDFWTAEYAFRVMSETNFNSVITDLKERKAKHEAEQKRIREEKERLEKEAIEKEKKAEEERKKHEAALAAEKVKAEEEKRKHEEALKKEREETERKQKEAEAKAKAEQDRIKKEAEEKVRQEREKAEEERKKTEAKLIAEREELKKKIDKIMNEGVTCPHCKKTFKIQ